MSSYTARLQLPGRTRIPMSVTVDVSDEKLRLVADDRTIGVWSLRDIDIDTRSDGFHLRIDGDEAILTMAEATRFAAEMKLSQPTPTPPARPGTDGVEKAPNQITDTRIQGRIGGLGQEDQLSEMRRQINDLREALRDPAVPPAVVFGRWLVLLKNLNRRLAQGTMPTPLFFRLNTELLDLMPSPAAAESTTVDSRLTA